MNIEEIMKEIPEAKCIKKQTVMNGYYIYQYSFGQILEMFENGDFRRRKKELVKKLGLAISDFCEHDDFRSAKTAEAKLRRLLKSIRNFGILHAYAYKVKCNMVFLQRKLHLFEERISV